MQVVKAFNNDRGNVLILSAILLVAILSICALAIDTGQMFIARERAQNVCDASALTGAQYLPGGSSSVGSTSPSSIQAKGLAAANNSLMPKWIVNDPDTNNPGVQVTYPSGTMTDAAGTTMTVALGDAIRVKGYVNAKFTFAKIFGISSRKIYAEAIAFRTLNQSFTTNLFAPICISDQTVFGYGSTPAMQFGQPYSLRVPQWTQGFLGPGNYLSLRYGSDSGAEDYRDRLAGNKPPITVTSTPPLDISTEPGTKGNSTYTGIRDRLRKETNSRYTNNATAWSNWLADYDSSKAMFPTTWRLVMIPVIQDTIESVNGQKPVKCVGIAGFFITDVSTDGMINGYFLQANLLGSDIRWLFPTTGRTSDSTQLMSNIRLGS